VRNGESGSLWGCAQSILITVPRTQDSLLVRLSDTRPGRVASSGTLFRRSSPKRRTQGLRPSRWNKDPPPLSPSGICPGSRRGRTGRTTLPHAGREDRAVGVCPRPRWICTIVARRSAGNQGKHPTVWRVAGYLDTSVREQQSRCSPSTKTDVNHEEGVHQAPPHLCASSPMCLLFWLFPNHNNPGPFD